ncbi:MAG: hypothetical protein ABTQ32_14780 [Myxococcaceae bacterium]
MTGIDMPPEYVMQAISSARTAPLLPLLDSACVMEAEVGEVRQKALEHWSLKQRPRGTRVEALVGSLVVPGQSRAVAKEHHFEHSGRQLERLDGVDAVHALDLLRSDSDELNWAERVPTVGNWESDSEFSEPLAALDSKTSRRDDLSELILSRASRGHGLSVWKEICERCRFVDAFDGPPRLSAAM